MNVIKVIIIGCIALFSINSSTFGQLSTVGKAAVKSGIKSSIKQSIKSNLKATAKDAVSHEVKERTIKYGVKSSLTKQLSKELTESATKRVSKKILKEGGEEIFEKTAKFSAKKLANKETRNIAKGAVEKSSKDFLLRKRNNFIIKNGIDLSNKITSKSTNAIIKQTPSIAIEKVLGKTGFNEVEKYLPDNFSKQIFIDDLACNPQLVKLFKKNPTLIKNYSQCIDSKYRTDISHLRYLNYHADSYADACQFSQTTYTRASDLKYVDDNLGNTIIKHTTTGEQLGIITGNTIKIADNHALLNMRLMKNMKYEVDNSAFITDKLGRPHKVECYISPKFGNVTKYERDKIKQRDFRKARTNASNLDSNKLNDDAGHIIAHDLGGVSDGINLVPQNRTLNRGQYKKWENEIKREVNRGHSVKINIELVYEGASERPSGFVCEYAKDGVLQSSKFFENALIAN